MKTKQKPTFVDIVE